MKITLTLQDISDLIDHREVEKEGIVLEIDKVEAKCGVRQHEHLSEHESLLSHIDRGCRNG